MTGAPLWMAAWWAPAIATAIILTIILIRSRA